VENLFLNLAGCQSAISGVFFVGVKRIKKGEKRKRG